MKKFLLIVAVAAVAMLADTRLVEAGRRGGCGGGGGCGGYGGGCGMGYGGGCGMGGCGMGYGGFAMGGCGMGGCGMGGCGMGYGGMMMGGCGMGGCGMGYGGGIGCAGGICQLNNLGGGIVTATGNEATLVVNLPADATLTIDNEATTSISSQRVFITPALESGKEYQYTLTAQITRDGKVQTLTEQVTVRPGEVSRVELTAPAAGVAAQ